MGQLMNHSEVLNMMVYHSASRVTSGIRTAVGRYGVDQHADGAASDANYNGYSYLTVQLTDIRASIDDTL